jgi:hypothetical protein
MKTTFAHAAPLLCLCLPLAVATAAQADMPRYHVAHAIAADNDWGIGVWSTSAAEAERMALQFCNDGAGDCRLAISEPAACAGIVESRDMTGFSYWVAYTSQIGAGGEQAERQALEARLMGWCGDSGGTCEVVDISCLGGH